MTSQSLTRRSINSVKWNAVESAASILIGFFQSILLANLLPVATFGVVAAATAVIALTRMISNFGMGGAILHRSSETMDLDRAAASHFSLSILFTLAWTALMLAGVYVFVDPAEGDLRLAFIVLILCDMIMQITQTSRIILVRKVEHRRLAVLGLTDTIVTAGLSIGLALKGYTLWALLASSISTVFMNVFFLFLWRPVWKPRLQWDPQTVRYLLKFGSKNFIGRVLLEALDRVDDIWTASFLGREAMGFYSRAYRFATYPRSIIAGPIYQVAGGVYAELKNDRERLTKAFVQVNSLMIRSGFFLAGLLALVAPEFIRIALGEKWLPMLVAFRLMLIYTLFDPVKQTLANVFIALGLPETVVRIRAIQFLIMIILLFMLTSRLGIAGVALAVDGMLVAGIVMFFREARAHVDYSLGQLLLVPTLALTAGLALGYAVVQSPAMDGSDWLSGLAKTIVFSITYGGILMIWDRRQVNEIWMLARNYLVKNRKLP